MMKIRKPEYKKAAGEDVNISTLRSKYRKFRRATAAFRQYRMQWEMRKLTF